MNHLHSLGCCCRDCRPPRPCDPRPIGRPGSAFFLFALFLSAFAGAWLIAWSATL